MPFHAITDRRLDLLPGQGICLAAGAGALIACAEGAATVLEVRAAAAADWELPLREAHGVPLRAGEAHGVVQSCVVSLHSAAGARLFYVAAQPPWRRAARACLHGLSKCAILFFSRRGVEQSGSSSGS